MLAVTIIREAVEEIRCYVRDKEMNSQVYSRLTSRGELLGVIVTLSLAADGWGSSVMGLVLGQLHRQEEGRLRLLPLCFCQLPRAASGLLAHTSVPSAG